MHLNLHIFLQFISLHFFTFALHFLTFLYIYQQILNHSKGGLEY